MNFDDLKEQLKEKWEETMSQLDDSPAFNTLKEKFETLNPNAQKATIWAGILCFSLFLFSCPMSYWSESSDNITVYNEKRDMIRDLLRASHMSNQTGNLPAQVSMADLTSQVQRALDNARLLPEQKLGVNQMDAKQLGAPLAPPNIQQEALEVSLSKLNLKQAVDLGHQLQDMNQAVKLAGLDIVANATNDHYFDVKYRLIKFSLPQEPVENEEDDSGKKQRRRRGN